VTSNEAGGAGYTPLRTNRYERKFLVEEMTLRQIELVVRLHPRMFYAPYPPRYVNNLYLDTADLENYYDNVHGASRRRKVRVRWYGELLGQIGQPLLEFKVKDGLIGRKHTYAMDSLTLDEGFDDHRWRQLATDSNLPPVVRHELHELAPVLLNRYFRRYYASRDGCFRLTIDSELSFYRAHQALGNCFLHRQVDSQSVVVELKYEVDAESQADRVASFFPFRVTRNSKYVQGVERVYL